MLCKTVDNLCLYQTEPNPRPCDSSLPSSWRLISEGGNIELDHHSLIATSHEYSINEYPIFMAREIIELFAYLNENAAESLLPDIKDLKKNREFKMK
jgi:hypothetical protein